MSHRFENPSDRELVLAERLFEVMRATDASPPSDLGEETSRRFPLSRLYHYLMDPDSRPNQKLEAALDADPTLCADFQRLVEKTASWHLPEVAAASTGQMTRRDATGCHIRFESSRAEPSQTYVIIELDDRERVPEWLVVFLGENRCRRFPLPEARDGVIQLLLEEDSDLLAGLTDIDSVIHIG